MGGRKEKDNWEKWQDKARCAYKGYDPTPRATGIYHVPYTDRRFIFFISYFDSDFHCSVFQFPLIRPRVA